MYVMNILHLVGVMRELFGTKESGEWNNSERLYYDGTRRTFLCFEEMELRLHLLLHTATVCGSILVQEIPTEDNIKKNCFKAPYLFL